MSQNDSKSCVFEVVFNFDKLYLQAQIEFLSKLKFCVALLPLHTSLSDFRSSGNIVKYTGKKLIREVSHRWGCQNAPTTPN